MESRRRYTKHLKPIELWSTPYERYRERSFCRKTIIELGLTPEKVRTKPFCYSEGIRKQIIKMEAEGFWSKKGKK